MINQMEKEDLSIQMEMFMKDIGKMEKLTAEEKWLKLMAQVIMVNGFKIKDKVKEFKKGLMDLFIKDNFKKVREVEKVQLHFKMDIIMKDFLRMMNLLMVK